jgi:putative transposase
LKQLPHRKSIRLKQYDYSSSGAYFVTICVQNRECLFGEIVNSEMIMNDAGRMIERLWRAIPARFPEYSFDEFTIMPNHFHRILSHSGVNQPGSAQGTSSETIGRVIQAFKSLTTNEYIIGVREYNWPPFAKKLWQRNYYEHVIRCEDDLRSTREYIRFNSRNWETDDEYVCRKK